MIKTHSKITCVVGNHETYLIKGITTTLDARMSEDEKRQHLWEHQQLSEDSKQYLLQLSPALIVKRGPFNIAILHYSMNEQGDYLNFIPKPSLTLCEQVFAIIKADIILYGHEYQGSTVVGNEKMYINCGSLGCPSQGNGIANAGFLTIDGSHAAYEAVQVHYDYQKVLDQIAAIQYPAYEEIKRIFYGTNRKE